MATSLRRRGDTSRSDRPGGASSASPSASPSTPRVPLFRPRSRSRVRLLAGIALLAAAVVINLAVYRRLDERVPVLQLTRDVPAGAQITAADLREVEASTSSDVNVVAASELSDVVGETAIVRLISGSLLVHQVLSPRQLVAAGASVVALTFPTGELPAGLRERSQVLLVLISSAGGTSTTSTVSARVMTLPAPVTGQTDRLGLSFELAATDAANVASAEKVRVILVDPGADPAYGSARGAGGSAPTASEPVTTPEVSSSVLPPPTLDPPPTVGISG